jgi:UDP-N-acetylglucosamine acyltransferase
VNIHPLAVVSAQAQLADDVTVGPFAIIEPDVVVGPGCTIEARVNIKMGTTLGPHNKVFEGTVLGGFPQHAKMPTNPGRVVIGAYNVFRENATVHRALQASAVTSIGDNNLFMVGAHVGHDCVVGNEGIFANNSMLGGHVTVDDQAYVSGGVAVHQFCRIGRLAMVGGMARVVQDVAPYVMIDGVSKYVCGLNSVGLRRRGYSFSDVAQLKAAYRLIFRSRSTWTEILETLKRDFSTGPAALLHDFLAASKRGVVRERRVALGPATIKLRTAEVDEDPGLHKLAG